MNSKAILFAPLILVVGLAQAEAKVSWYAANKAANNAGYSISLSDSIHKIELRGGWLCSVAPTSKQLPSYEAREITCQRGEATFEFSVQCESSRPKDHTQVRFKDSTGKDADFIEVGCELAK